MRMAGAPVRFLALVALLLSVVRLSAQCNQGFTFTASPPPVGGEYSSGQSVTFCYTVTNWNIVNVNWFQGVGLSFGAGWDLSTLTPGPPPATCGTSGGTWGWYDICDGTSGSSIGPVGPGFFFDLDNDGDPGNNFGDLCSGAVNWQFCWTISVAGGTDCVDGADLGVTANSYGDSETGAWGSAGCHNDPVPTLPATTNCCDADAGSNGAVTLCATSAAVDLAAYLGGTPDAGGAWTAPGGIATGSNLNPAVATSGSYTYSVASGSCTSSAQVAVTIYQPPNAGADGTLAICSNNTATNLGTIITGGQAGGAWTDPGNAAFSGWYDPAINASGTYTYTVVGSAPCANDQATVQVTETAPPTAGTDGAITVCADGSSFDLFTLLGGGPNAGGNWSAPGGTGSTSTYVPGTNTPGPYTYTVLGVAPCANDQAIVTVTQVNPVNAGTDGAITVCADGAAVDLLTALGSAGAGGTWAAPGGASVSNTYTPGTSIPGAYIYTIAAVAPCTNDQATVSITQNNPVNAGIDGAATVCSNGAAIDLFALLTGIAEAGGAWTAPGGAGSSNTYTPGASTAGVYTYTVTALAPCVNDLAMVTITQNDPVNAGTDGVITVCADGAAVDLFANLGGGPGAGGSWSAPGGGATSNIYTPGTTTPGVFTYTLAAFAPCTNDQSTVTVIQNDPVDAGSDGATTVCSDGAVIDLFALLGGPDAGGAWTAPGGGGASNIYTPGTSAPGTYTYEVTALAPCTNDQATVSITQNNPVDAGSDGSITLCDVDPTVNLLALLGAPDAGGTWTAPGGGANAGSFQPGTSAPGTYTYSVAALAPCVNDQSTVTVTQNTAVDAGADGAITVCADGASVDLLNVLGAPDVGGAWTDPGGTPMNATYIPGTSTPGNYTYTVTGIAPCPIDEATVTVTQNQPVDAGTDGAMTVCADGAPVDLFGLLGGSPDAGGAWTAPGGAGTSGTFTPGASAAGVYTHTVVALAPCPNDQAVVTITVNNPVDAGTDGATTVCSDGAAVDLFSLVGTPDGGGSWSSPGGGAASNTYTPGTSAAGTYSYTVTALAPCADDQSTVTVTENDPLNAGMDGAITVCADDGVVDLFTLLGGGPDADGTWTAPGGGATTNSYSPGTNAPGAYVYTVTPLAPCAIDQATITVTQNQPVDAGIDGAVTLCISSPVTDLFASLLGTPDGGGTWTAPGGGAFDGTFTPGTDAQGVYTYNVAALGPCTNASATVTVAVVSLPDPGVDGTITLCTSGPVQDLFAVLGGTPDAGGTWTAPGGGAHAGSMDPTSDAAGVYTYTINVPPPCASVSSTVTISLQAPPDPGLDGAELLCVTSPTVDLFGSIQGSPDAGGTWSAQGGGGFSGSFTPGTSTPGTYTYTVLGIAPCPNASSSVDVAVTSIPDAGANGNILLCTTGAPQDLFSLLGGSPDAGGSWTAPGGGANSGSVDPSIDPAGAYTYAIIAPAPCPSVSSTVTLALQTPPDPGTNGAELLCVTSVAIDLFGSLQGSPDAGGTWTAPGGGAFGGSFTPGTSVPGTYTYTVLGTAPCPNASASVDVAVTSIPDAGANGNITLCTTGAQQDLFALLGGSPDAGGTWTAPGGAAHAGTVDPASDPAGVYTYTIAAPAPCPSVSSTVTVALQAPPDPGSNGAELLCVTSPAIDLFGSLQGSPDAGGAWTAPGGGAFNGSFVPGTNAAGTYTYTVAGITPCPNASASVDVAVTDIPDAGTDGSITLCTTGAQQDLFVLLAGSPDGGGAWTAPGGGSNSGSVDPANDPAGAYTYSIAAPAPCPSVSSLVTVTLQAPPDPGTNGAALLCVTSPTLDLFGSLQGTPDAGGSWTAPGGGLFNGSFAPGTSTPGLYTYTVAGTAPCPGASSTVEVTVMDIPDPGTAGNITLCTSGATQDLFIVLGGAPDAGGTWTAPGGGAHSGTVDPATDAAGLYTYTIDVPLPCSSVSSTVTVALQAPPDPGQDGSAVLCVSSPPTALFTSLLGSPDAGGSWTAPGGGAFNGTFLPGTSIPGVYTYTVLGTAPCPLASSIVDVQVISYPDPGINGLLNLCATDVPSQLFASLGGTPDVGGTWTAPDGSAHSDVFDPTIDPSGIYTYTIAVPAPCSSVSATVTVSVQQPPSAGGDGALSLCISGSGTSLFAALNSTPDAGGTWTDPLGNPTDATFVPGSDVQGSYTYTVTGMAPCANASALVQVMVNDEPDAGVNGAIVLCTGGAPVDLFSNIGGAPDAGGSWTAPGGGANSGTFDPSTDVAGIYTYTITVPPPCSNASSTVTVVVQPGPEPGTDGAMTLCATDGPVLLFPALGGSPDANGTWTSPSGTGSDGTFNPSTDETGAYTYTLAGIAPCVAATAQVIMSVNQLPDAGVNGDITLCSVDAVVALFSELGGSPDATGTWTAPGGSAQSGTFDPAIDMAGTYTYTVAGAAPCPSDASIVTVAVVTPPNAGSNGVLSLCSSSAVEDLFAALNGSPDAGGIWSAPGGSASNGSLDPAFAQAGSYVYTVNGTTPCPSATAQIDVTITTAVDAGSDGAILLCSASSVIDLFDHLNGTPASGGAWTAPGGGASVSAFDPASSTPGTYTYTVVGAAPCPNATATVLVNVTSNPDAGLPGDATICMSDAPFALLDLLGGTPDDGGAWMTPGGTPHTGNFDPSTDAPGTYHYLIDVPPPCVSANSSVTIALVAPADPGVDGALTLCTTSTTEDLFAQLGGTPANTGTWSLNGQPHNTAFDPAVDAQGSYLYTVISNAPCPAVSAGVEVMVNTPPNPGTDGEAILCASGAPADLSTFLGGTPDAGGFWTINSAPHTSVIDPSADLAGDYVYTVNGIAPCPLASSTVTVTIASEPVPGTAGLHTVCTSGTPVDLFAELGGTPDIGGTWSGPSNVIDGQFDPATMTAGVYTYFIEVPAPCTSVSSVVTIIAVQPPDPGTDGSALLCASSSAADLFDVLEGSPQVGGTWTDPQGAPHGVLFNPALDVPGGYSYTVTGIAPCPSAGSVVTMNVVNEPDPGGNGALLLCQSDAAENLFDRLEGSPDEGGTWSGPSISADGFFDPATMLSGGYTYLLDAPEPCVDASSTVLVNVSIPPDAGLAGTGSLCTTSDAVDLFTLLTGTPEVGGTWTAPGGAPHANLFNPAQDIAGVYSYTVPGDVPCAAATASVTLSVATPPDAGMDGSITLCPDAEAVDLFELLGGSPDPGGTWTSPGGGSNSGIMDPSTDVEGTYTYGLIGAPPCGHDGSVVIVEVSDPVVATAATTDAICHEACDGTAMLSILGGTPDYTMQWSGNVAGSSAMEASGLCAGSYGIIITDANGCVGTVNYTIGEPPPLVIDAIGIGDENCIGSCDGYLNVVDGQGVLFSVDGGTTWVANNVISDLCAGGYLVMMQDVSGCLASTSAIIASPPPVTAGFYGAPDTMSVSNTLVEFTNQSGYATTFLWDFGGLATSTEGNPSFAFPDVLGGVYTVCLTAMDSHGCADSICLPIVVLDELFVTVPNAFTPNGDDINDLFVPVFNIAENAEEYEFMIFDRWGLRIFTSETVGEQWDGDYNGQIVQQDVYEWKLHCKDKITREEYDLIGHVTVVK